MTGKCGQVAEGRQLGPKLQNDPGMDFGTTAKAIDRAGALYWYVQTRMYIRIPTTPGPWILR